MDLLSITMFSIGLTLIGFFHSIPLTAVQPSYIFPERLQGAFRMGYVMGTIGGVFEKVFPARHDDRSLIGPALLSSSEASVSETASLVPPESDLGHSNYTTQRASYDADWDGFDPWSFHPLDGHLDAISSLYGTHGSINQFPNSLCVTILTCFALFLMISLYVFRKQKQYMEIADAELLRFIREVKSRRSFLMAKLDNAASTVDKELEEITSNITVQQERLGNQLASFQAEDFIYMEVNSFREHFEQQVQLEIDRQIPHVQSFLDELKEAKQAIPSSVEIQAHYEDFQNEVKRFKNQMVGILARIDADSVTYENFGGSMNPTEDFLSFIPVNQGHTPAASEELSPEIESESLDEIHMSEEEDTTWSSLEQGGSEECQEPGESEGETPEEREENDEIEEMKMPVDMEESQEQEEGKETEKTEESEEKKEIRDREQIEEKGESQQVELEGRREETPAGVAQWFAASGSPPLTPEQLEDGRRIRRERLQRRLKAAKRHHRNKANKTPSFEHLYRHPKGKCPSTNKGQRMASQFDASQTLIGLGLKRE